jgi:membrane fusion protein, multidrug efflux system
MHTTLGTAALLILMLLSGAAVGQALELGGVMEPNEVIEVSSQVPGIIDEVLVERGDRVKKGQVLARLKADMERIAVRLAEAQVQFSLRKAERNEELYESQLVSIHDKDELETEILMHRLQAEEAAQRLAMRTIRSPTEGVVTERFHAPGEYIGADPVVTVARLNPLNVEVIAPVELLSRITEGTQAEVRPEAPTGGTYVGEVVLVDQIIDAASGTFGVRVELPNEGYMLPAGLKCTVHFRSIQ